MKNQLIILMTVAGFWAVANGGTVTNTNDSGIGSLRQAIADAASGETITFDPALTGTITLTTGQLVIANKNLTIQGPGPGVLSINGNNASHVFQIDGAVVSLSGLTITGGNRFGGIDCGTATLTVTNCVITGNTGGGINIAEGTLNVVNSTVSGNDGGAISIFGLATLNVTGSTINNNTGGAFFGFGPIANITNSTISGNDLAIFYDGGNLNVVSSTIAGNGDAFAIGFDAGGPNDIISVRNSIIAGNQGNPSHCFRCTTTDVPPFFASQGFNLIGRAAASSHLAATDQAGTIAAPLDPGLDPNGLQDNGGPTQTINLVAGSAAIDRGNSSGRAADQRGRSRVFDFDNIPNATGGDGSDVGAVEFGSTATPPPAPPQVETPVMSPSGGAFKKNVIVTISDSMPSATIYYTTDGSDPTTSSPVYGATGNKKKFKGIKVKGTGTFTVKAMATASGFQNSGVASAVFYRIK